MNDTPPTDRPTTPRLDALIATREGVWLRLALVDLAGDLLAGILLSQIVYWTPRATVDKDGHWWIVKAYSDWWDEVRLTEKQARRALGLLAEAGLVETHVWKWNGTPKVHVRLDVEAMEEAMFRLAPQGTSTCPPRQDVPPSGADGRAPQGKTSSTQRPRPETTTEIVVSDDVRRLCDLLAELMVANGCRPPSITKSGWYDPVRLLIEKDGIEPARVERAIRWSQADEFWRANIHSGKALRERFDTLRQQAARARGGNVVEANLEAGAEFLRRRGRAS